MKLVNGEYGIKIEFAENEANVLVVENRKSMASIVMEFLKQYNGEEGTFVLSDDKTLNISKNIELIVDPFSINFNNKKIINGLYSHLTETGNDCLIEDKSKINELIINILDKLFFQETYIGIEHNLDFQWADLFKFYGVKISEQYDSLLEKIVEYIKVISEFSSVKIIVFVNLKSYLNDEEMEELYTQAFYSKIHLLLIENNEYIKLQQENVIIIDEDNCLIVK